MAILAIHTPLPTQTARSRVPSQRSAISAAPAFVPASPPEPCKDAGRYCRHPGLTPKNPHPWTTPPSAHCVIANRPGPPPGCRDHRCDGPGSPRGRMRAPARASALRLQAKSAVRRKCLTDRPVDQAALDVAAHGAPGCVAKGAECTEDEGLGGSHGAGGFCVFMTVIQSKA